MAKKTFDSKTVTDKFFFNGVQNTDNTQIAESTHDADDTQNTDDTQTTQKTTETAKKLTKRDARYNLLLDADLKIFLKQIVWEKRTTMTQYINDLIRAEYNKYIHAAEVEGRDPFVNWIEKP